MEKQEKLSDFESKVINAIDKIFIHFSKYDLSNLVNDVLIDLNYDVKELSDSFKDSIFPPAYPIIMLDLPFSFHPYPTNPNYEKAVCRLDAMQEKLIQEIRLRNIYLDEDHRFGW